jgi:hypothetical protein
VILLALAILHGPEQERPSMLAASARGPIAIDGRLSETDWAEVEPAKGFVQIDPDNGSPATHDTEVRILYDDRFLYVGARCRDEEGKDHTRVREIRRDFDYWTNDLFGVAFDAFGDGRNAMAFQVNPYGALRDLLVLDGEFYDRDWDSVWWARTERDADGWTAEIAIPWTTLRYPAGGEGWGVNFVRNIRRLNEITGWSPWPRNRNPYYMSFAGTLTGLAPPPPSTNLRVQPYGIAESEDGPGRNIDPDWGVDAKWALTPSSVLDLTYSMDFAQADADRQVINLSRFTVFFPEKRQFFLENASLFSIGSDTIVQPFFSRRIGLTTEGEPLPVTGGARFTRRGARQNLGGLALRTGEEGGNPASTFLLGRYAGNLTSSARLGALVASRFDEPSGTSGERDNTVVAIDGFFRPTPTLQVQAMISRSTTSGEGGDGFAGYLWAGNFADWGYTGWVQSVVSSDYEASSGFVARNNILVTSPAFDLDLRPAWLPRYVRALSPATTVYVYHGADDRKLQEATVKITPLGIEFQDGSALDVYVDPQWQVLERPFEPLPGLVADPGEYRYTRYGVEAKSDESRGLSAQLLASTGGYFDGTLTSLNLTARASPSPRLSFSLGFVRNSIQDLGEDNESRVTHLVAPELRLAFNPRTQLTAFYQYNTGAELASWNVRFSWEYRPLSYVYVVYNRFRDLNGAGTETEDEVVVKVNYLLGF